jgi:uncharacterized ferredoxin-like protein
LKSEDNCLEKVSMYSITKSKKLEGLQADGILGLSPNILNGKSIFGDLTTEVGFLNKLHH